MTFPFICLSPYHVHFLYSIIPRCHRASCQGFCPHITTGERRYLFMSIICHVLDVDGFFTGLALCYLPPGQRPCFIPDVMEFPRPYGIMPYVTL